MCVYSCVLVYNCIVNWDLVPGYSSLCCKGVWVTVSEDT